jgi:hypothetical protein
MNAKRRTYHLEVCPGQSFQGPTDDEITNAIRGLPGGVPSFVVLRKKKNHFMQASGSLADGYRLEYEEFSADGLWEHEKSPEGEVDVDTVVRALTAYAGDNDSWRDIPWKRLPKEVSDERGRKALEDWQAKQPQPGFFRSLVGGIIGYVLEESGLVGKQRRR